MDKNLAVLAENPALNHPPVVGRRNWKPNKLQAAAIECYAAGFLRAKTAQILMHHFWPEDEWSAKLLKSLRASLKIWEGIQAFRDLLYDRTIQNLDMDTPHIVQAVSGKAKRGDVPAAKFSLELTGRHSSKEQNVAAVQVVFANQIPRPGTTVQED